MFEYLSQLEKKLDYYLVEKAPMQIPENGRKVLADIIPWITLLYVIISFFAMGLAMIFNIFAVIGSIFSADIFFALFSLLATVVFVVFVALAAFSIPGLLKKTAQGWKLLFYSEVVYAVYIVLNFLGSPGIGTFFGIIWSLFLVLAVLYLIFQIKNYFKN